MASFQALVMLHIEVSKQFVFFFSQTMIEKNVFLPKPIYII